MPQPYLAPPDLAALDLFAVIARTRSFRKAALERGITASALSQTMRKLEEQLGTRLLNRTTRSVAPTEAGERLLERLGPALASISEAVDVVNAFRATPSGAVRINAPRPAVDFLLAPLITPFLRAYPEIRLEIIADASSIDIVEQGFDAGIRFGEELARDMVAVPLGPPLRYIVIASPGYLDRRGRPETPQQLTAHDCIRFRFPSGRIFPWSFRKSDQEVEFSPVGPLTLNDPLHVVRAAADGVGLARIIDGYAEDDLARGRVVEVLADWSPPIPGWYLYYSSRRHMPTALRAFLDFARDHHAAAPGARPAPERRQNVVGSSDSA